MTGKLVTASEGLRAPQAIGVFAKNRRGVTSVEFAMIAVPFFGLICAIFETSFVYIQSVQLQAATAAAARALMTSSVTGTITLNAFAQQYVCPRLTALFNCSLLQLSVSTPGSWSSAGAQEATGIYVSGYTGAQNVAIPQPGNIAVVQVAYPLNQIVAIMAGGVVNNQTITQIHAGQTSQSGGWQNIIVGTYAFQVEP
jgi:Flp pilus assembly protein TadG